MSPQELKTRIEEELWEDDGLDARHIRVIVRGRDVWLEGEVPTPAMYDLAERIVAQITGVGDYSPTRCPAPRSPMISAATATASIFAPTLRRT